MLPRSYAERLWSLRLMNFNLDMSTFTGTDWPCRLSCTQIANILPAFLRINLPAAQTWRRNLPSVHVILKYPQKSQMKYVSHKFYWYLKCQDISWLMSRGYCAFDIFQSHFLHGASHGSKLQTFIMITCKTICRNYLCTKKKNSSHWFLKK